MERWVRRRVVTLEQLMPIVAGQTISTAMAIMRILVPCALVLLTSSVAIKAPEVVNWPEGMEWAQEYLPLAEALILLPIASAMITYAASIRWEGRDVTIRDTLGVCAKRLGKIILTAVVAGLFMMGFGWAASVVYSVIALFPAMFGWIPVLGSLVTAVAGVLVWLVALVLEYISQVILNTGMLALMADGVGGRGQIRRATQILFVGQDETFPELVLIFVLWAIMYGFGELMVWLLPKFGLYTPGPVIMGLVRGATTTVSMMAMSVVYLEERGRQMVARFR